MHRNGNRAYVGETDPARARELIQNAIAGEVRELLAEYGKVRTLTGRSAVVRTGDLPAREIPTPAGAIEVGVPNTRLLRHGREV